MVLAIEGWRHQLLLPDAGAMRHLDGGSGRHLLAKPLAGRPQAATPPNRKTGTSQAIASSHPVAAARATPECQALKYQAPKC